MTRDEMIIVLKRELMDLSSKFDDDNYGDAIDAAQMDCGWSLPQTEDFKVKWLKERGKRHLYSFLIAPSANKFQFEQIHLEDRFDHYLKLIQYMDGLFEKAFAEELLFADVDGYELFGHKIDAGFQYEPETGKDLTYTENNKVIINP